MVLFCMGLLMAASVMEAALVEMSRDENVAMRQNGELFHYSVFHRHEAI